MNAGVYRINNTVNGKCYVGSSIDLERRQKEHFYSLKNNSHQNMHLQNSYNKYGRDCFEFVIIEALIISSNIKEELLSREQYWIDSLKPEYNILLVAGSSLGYSQTDETKQKISSSMKGVKKSEEHAENIRLSQKGKILTEEHKQKLATAAKNRKSTSRKVSIMIDGTEYISIKVASEITGVSYNTIQRRLVNENFQNYQYLDNKERKSLKKSPKNGLSFRNTPVIIDDVLYDSAMAASKILNMKVDTVKYRIASENFKNYRFK